MTQPGLAPVGQPAAGQPIVAFLAALLISFVVASMLGLTGPFTVFQGIAVAPFFIWELVIGLWMTFKGFNRSAPIVMAAMGTASPPAERTATSVRTDAGVAAKAGAA